MDNIGNEPFGIVNWVVCAVLLLASIVFGILGALRGKGTATTEEYLLGGRQMSSIPVALSLISSTISAISMLGLSSETYFYGSQYVVVLLGSLYGTIIIQNLMIPIVYPLDIISVNEYITLRFGSETLRKLSSASLILNNMIFNGICLYTPSLTLSTVTGLPSTYSIIIMGLIVSAYITVGGVKAIVYTDVIQSIFMILGVLVAVVVCVLELGGLGNVFSIANDGGRLEIFNFNPSPFVRYTFWSVQLQGLYNIIGWLGATQMAYMRFSSVPTLNQAKRMCSYFLIGLCVLWLTYLFSGIVAYATYSDCDPLTSGRIEEPDQILPYLIINKVSHINGIAGLFAAAVYSGMLSSVSTYANSVASMIWQDFMSKLKIFKFYSDKDVTRALKILSAVVGVSAIGLAMLVKHLGSIWVVTNSFFNAIDGARTGMFLAGMCAPWVNAKGAYAGFITTITFNLWILAGQFITGLGQPEKLPLSTEGCLENVESFNLTSFSLLDYTEENQTFTTTMVNDEPTEELHGESFYDLSFCYTGVLGIIMYYAVASIVSLCTGPLSPSAVDAKLISPRVLRVYKRLWEILKGSHSQSCGADLSKDKDYVTETGTEDTPQDISVKPQK